MFYECFSLGVALEFKIKWLLLVAQEITGSGFQSHELHKLVSWVGWKKN